jgi:hypothetical protein
LITLGAQRRELGDGYAPAFSGVVKFVPF